jgi:cytochrome bd ubiquinol oxidase subunit I
MTRPVDALLYARAQMGLSLAFHIVFAAVGVALPVLLVIADIRYLRTKDPEYLTISRRLAKGTSILFAVGAVSGTVLSFELGLLWPTFMERFGPLIGLPFALEGFAFFTEAIFLGIYLYGRDRVSPKLHLFSGVAVAVSGAASAFFVTLVNAFMNDPGDVLPTDPLAALFSPSWSHQVVHVLVSCYQATAFAMAGIHAAMLLREPASTFHRKALGIALPVACLTALLQPLVGDLATKHIAERQPLKLAAAEGHFETQARAPLRIGGIPDETAGRTRFAIEIPGGLSFLSFGDADAVVRGLRSFPRDQLPPVAQTHVAFQTMVGAGVAMAGLAVLLIVVYIRRRQLPTGRRWLWAIVVASPLGLVAMEAGWLLTEWGRQPWVVRGHLRTAEALTPFRPLGPPFVTFTAVYLLLGGIVAYLLYRQVRGPTAGLVEETGAPAKGHDAGA